ncbi:MAG: polysaccharide biosynthesis tyrosine autokinase [Propionibacteriaceae bacterium]|nr:polysaccharide biosynthesis tyrosine autokinase [Propionibacteriaceae bacterium]
MELRDFLNLLLRRWVTLVVCLVLGIVGAFAATRLMPVKYQASAELYFAARTPGATATSDIVQGSNYMRQAVLSYVDIATSAIVLEPVIEQLNLAPLTAQELAADIEARSPTNTVLITITVTQNDRELAAQIANATAQSLSDVVSNQLEKPSASSPSLVQATVTQPASVPETPSSPRPLMNLAIGALLGLALGIGVAWLRTLLDTKIDSPEIVKAITNQPMLGTIPFDPQIESSPLIIVDNPRAHAAEEIRGLRTNVIFSNVGGGNQTLIISSSNPSEGKTTTISNLAIALASLDKKIVLVDCDLRNPSVAKTMGMEGSTGLTDVLVGRATPADVIQRWGEDQLFVLPAGRTPPNPSELLGSEAMKILCDRLATIFDYVLIDAPPVLVATDATMLATLADGVILAIAHGETRRHSLAAAINHLNLVEAHLIGSVVTKVPVKKVGGYQSGYGYGYGYGYGGYGSGYGSNTATSTAPNPAVSPGKKLDLDETIVHPELTQEVSKLVTTEASAKRDPAKRAL